MRQLRLDKGLSVSELANKAGLSVSYVTEIEKGRKYPKADKISALATAMNVDYDTLVSLKLSKKLEPISDLLRSKFLTEIPLELFGIDPSDLLELLAEAPAKVSAMIRTFMDIALSYNMSVERLYQTMLRSYQEMHDNHFPELEADADRFLASFAGQGQMVHETLLANLLKTQYGTKIDYFDPLVNPDLMSLRSVYRPESATLYLNAGLSSEQRVFILAREVGFQYLALKNRPYTYSWVEAESFEQILNNYKASYFAGAILIRRDALIEKISALFAQESWDNDRFLALIHEFGSTPERFFYRLSNILPSHFGIDQLFFYRFNHTAGQTTFQLTKEMHLSRQQGPRRIADEHFCRRWIALTILQELSFLQQNKGQNETLCRAQLSEYADSGLQYLIISVAHPFQAATQQNMSVSMCFAMNDTLRSKVKFLQTDPASAPFRVVNDACERCSLFDCRERVAAPTVLQKKRQFASMKQAMEKFR
ncbi:helix-turn-helix domain-containing protein [Spirosoma sp. KUDC1026]|uniref:helix-turn-helix domain-containing protein n=1 Tax=Spirosoma sp. KUDC1026 TaxID=2745947 RepID=UPI00159BE926|nr:helix-turn-helix transcriptional regulator [Spirosoma sp. KUDC1026]QKZ13391.1 helix-turn-helix domain-containing protein [Spirosoma sp. KUDC1026]